MQLLGNAEKRWAGQSDQDPRPQRQRQPPRASSRAATPPPQPQPQPSAGSGSGSRKPVAFSKRSSNSSTRSSYLSGSKSPAIHSSEPKTLIRNRLPGNLAPLRVNAPIVTATHRDRNGKPAAQRPPLGKPFPTRQPAVSSLRVAAFWPELSAGRPISFSTPKSQFRNTQDRRYSGTTTPQKITTILDNELITTQEIADWAEGLTSAIHFL